MRDSEKSKAPPNYRKVELPDCCALCFYFRDYGSDYPDSPSTCGRHDIATDFNALCDNFEKAE